MAVRDGTRVWTWRSRFQFHISRKKGFVALMSFGPDVHPWLKLKCRGRNMYLTHGRQGPTLEVTGHFLEMTYQEDTLKGVVCKKRKPPFYKESHWGSKIHFTKTLLKGKFFERLQFQRQCLYCLYQSSLFCAKDFSLTRSSIKQRKGWKWLL